MLQTLLLAEAIAGEWFPSPLAYWEGNPYGVENVHPEKDGAREESPSQDSPTEPFDWEDYADPATAAFWREGDHSPPPPLLELIRDPSPENVARYRQWTQQKLEVSAWVSTLLASEVADAPSWEGVRVVYFYASECAYCRENTPYVLQLMERGADVMPVHLDLPSPAYPTSTPYSPEMGAFVSLRGTPTWVLVAGGRRRTVHGFADTRRLDDELRVLLGEER